MGKWSNDSACWVVHDVRLYSVLDTVVISGDDVCCSVVLELWLVCLCLVLCGPICLWHLLLVVHCGHQCTSAREWSVRSHLRWGLSVVCLWCTICSVVCPCQLFCSAWMCCLEDVYNVCNCDVISVVNVYLDHLKFCIVCINGRRYVCCSECNVISNECNEPTSWLVQHIGMHGGEVIYFGCVCFRGELGFLKCDGICMCVVNK